MHFRLNVVSIFVATVSRRAIRLPLGFLHYHDQRHRLRVSPKLLVVNLWSKQSTVKITRTVARMMPDQLPHPHILNVSEMQSPVSVGCCKSRKLFIPRVQNCVKWKQC